MISSPIPLLARHTIPSGGGELPGLACVSTSSCLIPSTDYHEALASSIATFQATLRTSFSGALSKFVAVDDMASKARRTRRHICWVM